jgi:LuxR family maltose regulon positive regulatory protein
VTTVQPSAPPFELVEPKLHPVTPRRGIVARSSLIQDVLASDAPVTTVVAPPGYGKTTFLGQWADAVDRPVAWLSADGGDDDTRVFLTYLAAALDRTSPIGPGTFEAISAQRPVPTILGRLLTALAVRDQPVAIVIDHAEAISNPVSLDAIEQVAMSLPADSRLTIASREALPTARLRAHGRLLELGPRELALDAVEAGALLAATEVDLAEDHVVELVTRTEGWPVGLYLASLAIRSAGPQADALDRLSGDSRFLSDYLRTELLDRIPPDEVAFLTRTSVLDTLTGPLCDAVLDETGSASRLVEIEGRNLLLVPLDDRREWFRYHQLLREFLQTELRRREPELVPELHRRAGAWFEEVGRPETALHHARVAGDGTTAARLINDLVQPTWATGRADTVLSWFEWLEDAGELQAHGAMAAHGSFVYALLGRPAESERWAAAARAGDPDQLLADGSTLGGLVAFLESIITRRGTAAMRADARQGQELLVPTHPYRPTAMFAEGVALLLEGDPDAADPILARAVDAALAVPAGPLAALVLSTRCGIAVDRDDWAAAAELGDRALALVSDGTYDEYWSSAAVFAWAARLAAHQKDEDVARAHLAKAVHLRPLLTYALPTFSVLSLLVMARTYLALLDPEGARAVLRQARDILQQRPRLGDLDDQVAELLSRVERANAPDGASALSAAELRLVPLLATHLTLKEIGERLFISRNTVKSETVSIYRKLGVSSRSEAVERLQELGLFAG